jgi:protein-S-isoprenylcysteine O-methyltransferase Ste14
MRGAMRFILLLLFLCVTLFLAAGTFAWPMGWVYVALTLLTILVSRLLALRAHPDLLVERMQAEDKADAKAWDKRLVPLIAIYLPLVMQIVAGLNYRFGWPPALPLWLALVGLALVVAGWAWATWAMTVNRFFSAMVRIQADRGHRVVENGPYRWMRHPAYAGGVIANLATPLMLGSAWALIPAGLTVALVVLRTSLEDRTLQAELPGYAAYAARTRYRLVPGVW